MNRLQRASSLCLAVEAQPEIMVSADRLEVSYLQATKAERIRHIGINRRKLI